MIFQIILITLLQIFVLGCAEILRVVGFSTLVTRKFAHCIAGLVAAFLPFVVDREAAIICGIVGSIAMAILVYRGDLRALGSSAHVDYGSILFPVALTFCALVYWTNDSYHAYQYGVIMLAIPDALAGYVGRVVSEKRKRQLLAKSVIGSGTFFITSTLLTFILLTVWHYDGSIVIVSLLFASVVTAVEAVTRYGFDNLTVPVIAGALILFL